MILLCYPKCSTCMATEKELDIHDIKYDKRDIKVENPNIEELTKWYKSSGLPLKKFFNTSGLVYKSLNLKDKLKEMTEEEQLELLSTDGMLVKRPMMIDSGKVVIGKKDILNKYIGD